MACNNCSDGCFDESVQLQQGPQGPSGADGSNGSNGTDGVDGIAILYQSTAINSPSTISSSYSNAISSISVPADTLETVGDMLRLELLVQGDTTGTSATVSASTTYSMQILFGSDQVFEAVVGYADVSKAAGGSFIVLDLVVSATNTLSGRLVSMKKGVGSRPDQFIYFGLSGIAEVMQIPPLDISGSSIGPITPTLSNSNNIDIQLKNSDNQSTSIASVTSVTIYKYLKS